ncbi:serine/threonine protein kinase [Affinibrenneria salicis]|uniref:Serine/threonine protein kinase n=1 Tax=Affinibrenneria salicis TaxID=2590031 RepID=A0A5J5FWI6_9GAMM|nr:serine/threonine-protein kinase [Affinibrenneria salicis]KAA8998178.1 serine/threonine protein kinase [Affinibrenneria salicis]
MPEIDNKNPNALPIGYRFNEFEIQEVIGGGGFGIVYRAWDHQLQRTIAIKEYMPSSLAVRNEDYTLGLRGERFSKTFQAGLNSFIKEARLLARFNHPSLLHVIRFWVQNDTAYMGTQFYSGTTLKNLYQQQPEIINEEWIRRLLPPLFGAINTIHREGYLHRDISLDNIQIQENFLPVLLDFGSARKEISNLSDETETMLKPGFAPIEQYTENNDGDQGPWTDIYALGAVLHTLIVGSPPPVSVVRSIEDVYQPLAERRPPGYSLPLLTAIDKALSLRPEDRPQVIDEFAQLLELSVSEVNDIVGASSRMPGTMLVAVGQAEKVSETEQKKQRLLGWLKPLGIGAGMALAAFVGVMVGLSQGKDDTDDGSLALANNAPAAQPQPMPRAPAARPANDAPAPAQTAADDALASTQPPAQEQPAAEPEPVAPPPLIARVYFKLSPGDSVLLNDDSQAITPDGNGFVVMQLPAGQHQLTIQSQNKRRQQSLIIDKPGTWLINPAG